MQEGLSVLHENQFVFKSSCAWINLVTNQKLPGISLQTNHNPHNWVISSAKDYKCTGSPRVITELVHPISCIMHTEYALSYTVSSPSEPLDRSWYWIGSMNFFLQGLVCAGMADMTRPAEKLSTAQSAVLMATGKSQWYSVPVHPLYNCIHFFIVFCQH